MTDPPRTWVLESADDERPFTANTLRRLHWSRQRKLIAAYRVLWGWLALVAKLPKELPPVRIDVTPLHADRRSPQDVGACAPAVKAAVDGLRDAGCLIDDTAAHVVGITYHPPIVVGRDGLRLTLTEQEN